MHDDIIEFENDGAVSDCSDKPEAKVSKKKINPFEKLGLESFAFKGTSRLGYKLPTPIQRRAIPFILKGRDVVAMARTGSGKTAAFVLPMIQRLREHGMKVGVRGLILEPTRELAFQVAKVIRQLACSTNFRICVIVGGAGMDAQFDKLSNNPDIVVGCPGRLVHHLVETDLSLSAVEYLVLDEADQMFELGLGEQLREILKDIPPTRQCVLVSATLPAQLVEFSRVGLSQPEFIRLDLENVLSPDLDSWFLYSRGEEKLATVLYLLREVLSSANMSKRGLGEGILIFVSSRHHVQLLGALLEKAGIPTSMAYGAMDLQARCESLAAFRKLKTKVLCVTDVAARGLDIPIVGTVINFDFPTSPKHFIHRAGRTARANRKGLAISLVTRDELAYAVELLLFVGVQFQLPDDIGNTASIDSSLRTPDGKPKMLLGGVPNISDDVEFVRELIEEDPEIEAMYKTMMRSYIQYNKVRRQASKQSIKRAKQIIAGDAARILNCIHPGLRSPKSKDENPVVPSVSESCWKIFVQETPDRAAILDMLHSVKPKCTSVLKRGGRHGGVLATDVVNKMQKYHFGSNPKNFMQDVQKVCSPNKDDEENDAYSTESSDTEYGALDSVFDWKSIAKKKGQFFLSTEKSEADKNAENRESHLLMGNSLSAMAEAQFDLLPDNESEQRKVSYVKKWNAQKRKYVMTAVDESGKALSNKQVKRRNEAGIIVRGELEKTGIYDKWVKASKKRIQKVGEDEGGNISESLKKKRKFEAESDDDEAAALPPLSSLTTDTSLVEAIEKGGKLTHKQQRKAKKLLATQKGTLRCGKANIKDELKSAKQVIKLKKDSFKKKANQNPRLRAAEARKGKEKHMRKRKQQGEEKNVFKRSFAIGSSNRKRR